MRRLLVTASAVAGCGWFVLTGQEPAPSTVYTAGQAARGKTAYQSTCGKCHTESLLGRTGKPGELPPVDSLPAVMRDVVRAAGGKVPPLAGADQDTYLDLTAYVLQANGAKSGTQALASGTAVAIGSVVAPRAAEK